MQVLKGEHIHLRALEPEDIDFLFITENDTSFWEISNTEAPFSRYILEQYIMNSHQDIYTAKQLRLMIAENNSDEVVGMIDLFDYNPQHQRAGIGILISKEKHEKGYASEALTLLINYCFTTLNFHQLFANISSDNEASIALFNKFNFKEIGAKKDWIFNGTTYKDELLFQLIKS